MMPFMMIGFSLPSFIFLILGISQGKKKFIILALWLSLFAMVFHYYLAGLEILGNYFNYCHAALYSLNMVVMIISIIYLLIFSSVRSQRNIWFSFGAPLLIIVMEGLLLIANLWINAYFIEDKKSGTSIISLYSEDKTSYCPHKYVFYKITENNEIKYMCPNYYILIPSIGHVDQPPPELLPYLQDKTENKAARS